MSYVQHRYILHSDKVFSSISTSRDSGVKEGRVTTRSEDANANPTWLTFEACGDFQVKFVAQGRHTSGTTKVSRLEDLLASSFDIGLILSVTFQTTMSNTGWFQFLKSLFLVITIVNEERFWYIEAILRRGFEFWEIEMRTFLHCST